ncbi:ImmA/IrrE family metallo-endopeptidase [Candidatus Poriferisodalis sp.]|uniref:ImmA/IrrE family metallo-endopeptidase n=1 Tax=Candidatus Poriferisodalis sp. TaxID=3101277 RepID=UPI003B0275C5
MSTEAEAGKELPADEQGRSGPQRRVSVRVKVQPALLEWAQARSGVDDEKMRRLFPRFDEWKSRTRQPTIRQLQKFAATTYTPFGFLLLAEPPTETLPIADFRTRAKSAAASRTSANLLDTLYACQARQEWFRDNQLLYNESPVEMVRSATTTTSHVDAASLLRGALGWDSEFRKNISSQEEALKELRERAEHIGVLVMISGTVGSNTRRKLNPSEFSGFALIDECAPLVFVNGADAKSAQMFTLAHELAHLLLGETGLSDTSNQTVAEANQERWCNAVAAELLVPMADFRQRFDSRRGVRSQLESLARHYRVSTQTVLVRCREAGLIGQDECMRELEIERARTANHATQRDSSARGGNFYAMKSIQVGKRFARDVISSTFEGRTTYTEAYRLLDVKNANVIERFGQHLGIV